MSTWIYMVSDGDGAAKTNSESAARALESAGAGFRRCSPDEWARKRRQQQEAERREGREGTGG